MFVRYCRDLTMLFIVVLAAAMLLAGCAGHHDLIPSSRIIEDAPAPPSAPQESSPAQTAVIQEPLVITFAPIMFDFDKYNIRGDQEFVIGRNVVAAGTWRPDTARKGFTLAGYCDERGTSEYNLALGQRRADTVRKAMMQRGVTAEMQTISYGKEFAAGHDEIGWAIDRRVEIKVK